MRASVVRCLVEGPASVEELASFFDSPNFSRRVRIEGHDEAIVLELDGVAPSEVAAELHRRNLELTLISEAALLKKLEPLFAEISDEDDLQQGRQALLGLGALWHSDLALLELLRKLGGHPRASVRAGVIAVATRVGYRLFLLELSARETDPVLRRILRTATGFEELP